MRVGVNTLFLIPGEVGGSETYLRQTLRALAEFSPEVELVLFTNREGDSALRDDLSRFRQVEFVMLDFHAANRYMRIVREQTELPFRIRGTGIDLLWSPGYTAPRFCSCPQVTTILDMQYKTHPEDLSFLARMTTAVLIGVAARQSRRILTISEFSKREILKYTAAKPETISVTLLAADAAFSRELSASEVRRRVGALTAHDGRYILVASNTYPHKNVHAAVEGFGRLIDSLPHRLILVGHARLGEPAVRGAIASRSDPSRIQRLDYVSREDLIALYQGADLFLFPSLYEGFGLPVLEAMMAGTPVVTTRMGAIPEIAGKHVVYFDHTVPGNLAAKIREILRWTEDERRDRCAQAREHAGRFSWRETAAGILKCFRQSLEVTGSGMRER